MSHSRSSRSPDTAPWRAVWTLYAQVPPAQPGVVLAAIRRAAQPMYPAILIDPGTALVAERLAALAAGQPLVGPEATADIGEATRRAISAAFAFSFATELILRAQARLVLRGLVPGSDPRPALAAELVCTAFDYLLWRDLSGYLGKPGLPNVSALDAYASGIISAARQRSLEAVGRSPSGSSWPALVRAAWD